MDNEQDYNQILDRLLDDTDMDDEVSRRMAYNACIAYAEREFDADLRMNVFVSLAAARLAQAHVHFAVIKSMVPMPQDARLHLRYAEQGGPVLTGNSAGLQYLSDLCAVLADAPLPEGGGPEPHVHLYGGEPPMFGSSYAVTLYRSKDNWFDRHAAVLENDAETATEDLADAVPPREIAPEQIAAIEFYEDEKNPMPPPLYLRYDKLYRVLNCRSHNADEIVWAKPPASGGAGRMHVFTLRDDAQELFEIALDLDDAGIHYFTRSDLEQIWGASTQPIG